jgi:ribosomal protein S18 acetylase RimI-like enzyme
MNKTLKLVPLEEEYFEKVIKLGNDVHGDAYLTQEIIDKIYKRSFKDDINCSFVMIDVAKVGLDNEKVVGFRLTYAPTNWAIDQWCSPDLWDLPIEQLCYFKSSTVDADYRCHGIAKQMLKASIDAAIQQGAKGGICHTWMQSPGNVAYLYFIKCGGQHLKTYPNRWLENSYAGYRCIVCGVDEYCHCDAGEMILYFEQN